MSELDQIRERLAQTPTSDLKRLLAAASKDDSPEHEAAARNRIWRRMSEEALARQGHAPKRLVDTDEFSAALLSRAANIEPPFAHNARLYRRLAPKPVHRFRFAFAGVGAAFAMAAIVFVVLPPRIDYGPGVPRPVKKLAIPGAHPSEEIAEISLQVHGSGVRVFHEDGSAAIDHVAVGDSVELAGNDPARWSLEGVGEALLDGESAKLTLAASDSHGVRLNLASGRVAIHALKRSADAPLTILAQDVEVRVVGTIFSVETGAGGPIVNVREGLVRVTPPGKEAVMVGAGSHWPANAVANAGWTDQAMRTLAGATAQAVIPSMAVAAAELPQPTESIEEHRRRADRHHGRETNEPAVIEEAPVAKAPVAVAAIQKPAAIQPAPAMFGTPGFRQSDTAVVVSGGGVAPAPQVVKPVAKEATAPIGGPMFDLDAEATKYDGRSPSELEVAVSRNKRRGHDGYHDLAVVYRALADNNGASAGEKRNASRSLAELLDNEMGAVQMAIPVWRDMASRLEAPDRSEVRLAVLADLMELGHDDDALAAAGDCLKECMGDQRTFGLVLQARLLAQDGRTDEARAATKQLPSLGAAHQKTAFFFAQRADRFEASGQHERAKVAAQLSLALDPFSLQAPGLRAKLR